MIDDAPARPLSRADAMGELATQTQPSAAEPGNGSAAALALQSPPASGIESITLLDGGGQAYPRMLAAIDGAKERIDLQAYALTSVGVGARFLQALAAAAGRGVAVRIVIDGWGSARRGRSIVAALRASGCDARIHHRLWALFAGRFARNHRKMLIVDDQVAFIGGMNIGDENLEGGARPAWADLALEIRGRQCGVVRALAHGRHVESRSGPLRIALCGMGGGWRLRRRYLRAFKRARHRIDIAHGYFLPDLAIVRAIAAAARRGVRVRLLLAGRSDVPLVRLGSRRLHRRLLAAGVTIHEWDGSVLHAKVATVDGECLLLGSFNLDPFSLANLETLVEVYDDGVVLQVQRWIEAHALDSRPVTVAEAGTVARRWLLEPIGWFIARLVGMIALAMASRAPRFGITKYVAPAPTSEAGSTAEEWDG